jgi:diadenosine tetraphosphate (Ap4A) HIT family hydrolase
MSDCVYCNQSWQEILFENNSGLVIRDPNPVSPGHSLVLLRRHVASFFNMNFIERDHILDLLDKVRDDVEKKFKPDGFNVGINDGEAAGQSVLHAHIHLIPRYSGDCENPRGGVRWVLPEKADYWNA